MDGFDKILGNIKKTGNEFPELKAFIMYWEQRKSHVFPPFRGGGIPGLNMSEPGNKPIKPVNTMRLVTVEISMFHIWSIRSDNCICSTAIY